MASPITESSKRTTNRLNALGKRSASGNTPQPPQKTRVIEGNGIETDVSLKSPSRSTAASRTLRHPRRSNNQTSHGQKITRGQDPYSVPTHEQPEPIQLFPERENSPAQTRKSTRARKPPARLGQSNAPQHQPRGRPRKCRAARQTPPQNDSPGEVENRSTVALPVSSRTRRNKASAEAHEGVTQEQGLSGKSTSLSQSKNRSYQNDASSSTHTGGNQDSVGEGDDSGTTNDASHAEHADRDLDNGTDSGSNLRTSSMELDETDLNKAAELLDCGEFWLKLREGVETLRSQSGPRMLERRTRAFLQNAKDLQRACKLRSTIEPCEASFRDATHNIHENIGDMETLASQISRSLSKKSSSDIYHHVIERLVGLVESMLFYGFYHDNFAYSTLEEPTRVLKMIIDLIKPLPLFKDKTSTTAGIRRTVNQTIKLNVGKLIKTYENFLSKEHEKEKTRDAEARRRQGRAKVKMEREREERRRRREIEKQQQAIDRWISELWSKDQQLKAQQIEHQKLRLLYKNPTRLQRGSQLSFLSHSPEPGPRAKPPGIQLEPIDDDSNIEFHDRGRNRSVDPQMNGTARFLANQNHPNGLQTPSPAISEADGILATTNLAPLGPRDEEALLLRPRLLSQKAPDYRRPQQNTDEKWTTPELQALVDGLQRHRHGDDRFYWIWKDSTAGRAGTPLRTRSMDDIVKQARSLKQMCLRDLDWIRNHGDLGWLMSVND